jgi:hypothetical protein
MDGQSPETVLSSTSRFRNAKAARVFSKVIAALGVL